MGASVNQIFYPASLNELFSIWERYPSASLYAGGTGFIWRQGKTVLELPPFILCLDKINDLNRITRTEHYLEIGTMAKLNTLIRLGKIVPQVLCKCLEKIGGVQLRNLATIGGNICGSSLLNTAAPLIALDAQYELRNAQNSRWISAARFHTERNTALGKQELLTRIRLPLHKWDYSMYKKFFSQEIYTDKILVFLAKVQKNILTDIKVVYKGTAILRNKSAESMIIGKLLPLHRKTADDFIESWSNFLDENGKMDNFLKNKLLNCIENNVFNLCE